MNDTSTFLKTLLSGLIMLSSISLAQEKQTLFAGLVNSKGYVVGAKLSASGIYQHGGDTTWHHIGMNHPRVSAIAYDPQNLDVIFLACGNGALRTKDGGKHWKITTDWRVTETQDICVDANDTQSFYLATAYGIFRTHDQGEHWIESNNGLKRKYTQAIAADRKQKGRLLAATEGGICLSTDGAQKWKVVGAKGMAASDVKQSASQPSVWIAATDSNGILLSNDNGNSWRFADGIVKNQSVYAVAIDPFDADHMAAVGWNTWVYLSRDGGKTWQQSKEGLPTPHFYRLIFDVNEAERLWAATAEEGIFSLAPSGNEWEFRGMYGALVFDLMFMPRKLN